MSAEAISAEESVRASIDRFTRYIGCGETRPDPDDIVLVPPNAKLVDAFPIAHDLIRRDRAVRIIADSVTLARQWPSWIEKSKNLVLTELHAYRADDIAATTFRARSAIREWLDATFAGSFTELRGSEVFYGSATQRFLQPTLRSAILCDNLLLCHANAAWHISDLRWEALREFERRLGRSVGAAQPGPLRSISWRLGVAALTLGGVSLAAGKQIVSWVRSRRSLRHLRSLRARPQVNRSPRLWVVLTPDWSRLNRHVIESVVRPELTQGRRPGVLLFSSLHAGARSEHDMRKHSGRELWPALGPLLEDLGAGPIDQVVMPESAPRAVRTTLRAVRRSLRAAARIVAAGPQVERGGFRLDLSTHLISVVKLVTQDLMLASAAETATLEASRRQDFSGSLIVFAGTSSVADVWLQRRGAVTLDFVHGSTSSEWVGLHESPSSIRAVWTYPDADANSALGRDVVVGGMPRRVARRARRVALSRVLILSNYVHRDAVTVFGYPLAPFQDELLDVVPLIVDAFAGRFRVRWRPHPADDEGAVRHTLLRHSNVELARSHTLEEDVDWADVVISSLSSATIEATLADVPIFVHAIPVFQKAATQIGFCPERCFFHAREFLPRFQSCIRRMDANDPNALEPERRLRSRLFGPSGAPDTLMEALARRSNAGQVASSLNALLLRKRYIA